MEYRNPTYNAHGGIDCEINHPTFGWIPHTVDPKDTDLWKRVNAGPIAPYVKPAPVPPTAEDVRFERDHLIAECDWTQLPDSPLTAAQKTAWATYRQALRDITKQAGFPTNVTWPAKPV